MKLISLYIENYKKFKRKEIVFWESQSEIEKMLYRNATITAFIGLNGTGKTTILSLIANIFRNLERSQAKIPTDFKLNYEINDHQVSIQRYEEVVYMRIDGKETFVLPERGRRKGQDYYNKEKVPSDYTEKTKKFHEILDFIPRRVIVSGFDSEYELEYPINLLATKLLKINSKLYYENTYGMDLSEGIFKFINMYFQNQQLNYIFKKMNISFVNKIFARYSHPTFYKFESGENIHDRFYEELGYCYLEDYGKFLIKKSDIPYFDDLMKIKKKYPKEFRDFYNEDFITGEFFEVFGNEMDVDGFNVIFNFEHFHKDYIMELIYILLKHKHLYFNDLIIKRNEGEEYKIKNMSTGEKLLFGRLFFLLTHIENDCILIIEEPELHLNYSWNKHLLPILSILLKEYDCHLLISSHNYSFINSLFSEQIRILENDEIKTPEFNTFLADERVILDKLVDNEQMENRFEEVVIQALKEEDRASLKAFFEAMGESFLKVMVFKKLLELGEINVES